jgi:hypothetical protein
MIEVQSDGIQMVVSTVAATNEAANRRNTLIVTSGHIWHSGDQLASIESDGLYGLKTKQKFVTTGKDGKLCYLDGQSLYLRFEPVTGGVRIGGDNHPDAIAKFKMLAGGTET